MGVLTKHLKLFKPSENDYYNVEKDQNENFDKIDEAIEDLDTGVKNLGIGKENAFDKNTGFNLPKTDSYQTDDSNIIFTAKGGKNLYTILMSSFKKAYDKGVEAFNLASTKFDKKGGEITGNLSIKTKYYPAIKGNKKDVDDWYLGSSSRSGSPVTFYKDNKGSPSGATYLDLFEDRLSANKPIYTNDVRNTTEEDLGNVLGVTRYNKSLNVSGTKYAGQAYFDNNTKKMYICTKTNTYMSANADCYMSFDNNTLLKLIKRLDDTKSNLLEVNGTRYSNLVFKISNATWTSSRKKILFDSKFKKFCLAVIIVDRYTASKTYSVGEYDAHGFTAYQQEGYEDTFQYIAIGY